MANPRDKTNDVRFEAAIDTHQQDKLESDARADEQDARADISERSTADRTASVDARFNAVRVISWFRWFLGVFTAVLVTLVIVQATIRDNSIENCEHSSAFANASALNWLQSSNIRRADGDITTADRYLANVFIMRKSIPVPHDWKGDPYKRGQNESDRTEGCQQEFPSFLPFIE